MTSKENKNPEEKEEHELNTSDRMSLINKQIDENFLMDTYETFLKRDEVFMENNHTLVDVNDYVFNDVEFLHDHYLNKEKGLFQKLNKCNSKIGSLILQKIFIKPIHDINILKVVIIFYHFGIFFKFNVSFLIRLKRMKKKKEPFRMLLIIVH
jgi:hypothetical protein